MKNYRLKVIDENAISRDIVVGLIVIVVAIAVPVIQATMYLYSGIWQSFSIITPLNWVGLDWAAYPHSWYGLHHILAWLHVSIGILALMPLAVYISHLYYKFEHAIEVAAIEASSSQ